MAKKKNDETTVIGSYEQADAALKAIGMIDINVAKIEADMNGQILLIKEEAEFKTRPMLTERKGLEKSILEFAEEHKEDFVTSRSKRLTFGSISFRVTESLKYITNSDAVVRVLKALGMSSLLRVKEEPDKDSILKLSDAEILKLGAKRERKDKPRIEVDLDKIRATI